MEPIAEASGPPPGGALRSTGTGAAAEAIPGARRQLLLGEILPTVKNNASFGARLTFGVRKAALNDTVQAAAKEVCVRLLP